MAEIEHYVDPLDKAHVRFKEVKDIKLSLLPKEIQLEGKTDLTEMTIGDAVAQVRVDLLVRVMLLIYRALSTTRPSVTSSPELSSS
jgi:glycyl-tRNA synthetase (class II)